MVSEQFQSSFRAVSEQFSYDILMENLAIQNLDSTLSQVENKDPGVVARFSVKEYLRTYYTILTW